jgi:D-glycero-alpha-D-manno-heptose-7-phosphate kinase
MNIRAKAPLRISFAGGGTDVPPYPELHGGCVLNATINYYAFGTLRPRNDRRIKLQSADLDLQVEFNIADEVNFDGKLDLAKAAIKRLGALNFHGFDIFLQSEAPPGSGLGSSSALIVALVGLVKELRVFPLDNYEVAQLAYVIERKDLGINGGLQDQYAAVFGGFNFIEFEKDRVIVNPLRISRDTLNELEHNLVLCYTNTIRRSDRIIDDQTTRLKAKNEDTVNALAQQKELAVAMKNDLLRNKLDHFGELMHSAWQAKKRMSDHISNAQIDEFYEEARKQGALGGKITGAGGGGFMMFYCEFERRHKVAAQLRKMGAVPTEFAFDPNGLQTWRIQEPFFGALDGAASSRQIHAA